jgi:hypothetical protein
VIEMATSEEEATGYLNDIYNELLQKRVNLLQELDDIRREMDDILLSIRRIEDQDEEDSCPTSESARED